MHDAHAPLNAAGGRRVVHIVDDEPAIRRAIGFMLRAAGFDPILWESGVALLDHADRLAPGCILLDVRMPGFDGLEVQRRLAAGGVVLPVIVLTGHVDVAIGLAAMRANAVDFLFKPFEKRILLASLDEAFKLLASRHYWDERRYDARGAMAALDEREQQVLLEFASGSRLELVATQLRTSPGAVEMARTSALAKLGAPSLAEALKVAVISGLG